MVLAASCTGSDGNVNISRDGNTSKSADTLYTQQMAMSIYGYHPLKALQIIDSAVILGNMSHVRANLLKSRIYSYSRMPDQIDSLLGGQKGVRYDS